MKLRVISTLFGLVILFSVISQYDTIVLNIAVSLIIFLAVDELVTVADCNSSIKYTARLFCLLISLVNVAILGKVLPMLLFLFTLIVCCFLLKNQATIRAEQVGYIIFFTVAITLSINILVYLRDTFGVVVGLYGVLVSLGGAWMGDTGAYFCGTLFGKRKLAPNISPKKTVEGAIGGIIISLMGQILVANIYVYVAGGMGIAVAIDFLTLIIISPIIAVLCIIGDLIASVIKRQCHIKDFGKIMPGHGGVLDRFDSVILVLPFVYYLFLYNPLIRVINL